MPQTNQPPGSRHRIWPEPPQAWEVHRRTSSTVSETLGDGVRQPPDDVIAHVVIALSRYLRYLRAEGRRSPAQLDDLTTFLAGHVRRCHDVPLLDPPWARPNPATVHSRLLLTKREAAEQLGVSLRTIERLISAGRLPLVHVEGAARVRVSDLETYVEGLEVADRTNPSPAD